MRGLILAAALALAACGQSAIPGDADSTGTSERTLPAGAIVGVGADWTLNADPAPQAISFVVDDGAEPVEIAETWAAPETTESGYRITSGDLVVDLLDARCELNAIEYPMHATITLRGGTTYEGCAAMRWDHQLLALMPQINACVAQSPNTTWVSYAGNDADGATWVRMSGDGAEIDCRVTDGNVIVTRRDNARFMATENTAIFVRGSGDNPGGECYEAPEVRSASGELLGWMMDPLGC